MTAGSIYYADLPYAGRRPVIVISRDSLNRGNRVVVVPCTTSGLARRSTYRNCVPFNAGDFGLSENCAAQAEAIAAIPVSLIETESPIGILDDEALRDVIRAVGYALDAECEPA